MRQGVLRKIKNQREGLPSPPPPQTKLTIAKKRSLQSGNLVAPFLVHTHVWVSDTPPPPPPAQKTPWVWGQNKLCT